MQLSLLDRKPFLLAFFTELNGENPQLQNPYNTAVVSGSNATLQCASRVPNENNFRPAWRYLKYDHNSLTDDAQLVQRLQALPAKQRGVGGSRTSDKYIVKLLDGNRSELFLQSVDASLAGAYICSSAVESSNLVAELIVLGMNKTPYER